MYMNDGMHRLRIVGRLPTAAASTIESAAPRPRDERQQAAMEELASTDLSCWRDSNGRVSRRRGVRLQVQPPALGMQLARCNRWLPVRAEPSVQTRDVSSWRSSSRAELSSITACNGCAPKEERLAPLDTGRLDQK